MANSSIKIFDIPVANTVTINSKFLSIDANVKRTELITAHDLTIYLANTVLYKSQVNTTFDQANAAFNHANLAYITANLAYHTANVGYRTANLSYHTANVGYYTANLSYHTANVAYYTANLAYYTANQAYSTANISYSVANSSYNLSNLAFEVANSVISFYDANNISNRIVNAHNQANTAYDQANTKFASSGGSISGAVTINSSLTVTGNVTFSGNVTTVSANNLTVQDNMIYLNEGTSGNTNPDLGFAGAYNDGVYHHCGFFRDATDGVWKVFDNYAPEPDESVWIDTSNSTFRLADFVANNLYGYANASNLIFGTVSTERLGLSGTANSVTYLAGDNSWKPITSSEISAAGTANSNTYLAGDNSWKPIVSGATLVQDETSNTAYYIGLSSSVNGAWLEAYISPNKLTYNPALNRLGLGTNTAQTSLHIVSNDAIIIPSGSDSERPVGINGMIRYNTSNNQIEAYSNNSWGQIGSGSTTYNYPVRQSFVATANQTIFNVSGDYIPGELDVYYNGVKLINGTEVNVSSGNTVVLYSGASENATIQIVGTNYYNAISTQNSIQKRQSFVATANQTVFTITGGYTPGMADVFYNGSKLVNGYDVDISSGSTITLTSPSANGAYIDVISIDSITYVDAVKKSGDIMTGSLTAPSFSGNGANLTSLSVSNLSAIGTANSSTYLAGDSSWKEINLSNLDANNLTSGTVNSARLGSGTANANTYLAGDNSWKSLGASGATLSNDISSNATYYIGMSSATTGAWLNAYVANSKLYFNPNTGTLSATIFNSLSDAELKQNIQPINSSINIVEQLNPVSFVWKDSGIKSFGVIAQELEQILPELVTSGNHKTVNYDGLIAILIKAVQELSNKVKELENK